MSRVNKPTQRSAAVSTTRTLFGAVTSPAVLLPVGDLAIRQAALVLGSGSCPWISRNVAGSVLGGARKR